MKIGIRSCLVIIWLLLIKGLLKLVTTCAVLETRHKELQREFGQRRKWTPAPGE